MKIVVALSGAKERKAAWNGLLMRYGNIGVSGTELTQVVVAEQLAKNEHDVYMYSDMYIPSTINNVKYVIDEIEILDCDVMITVPWFECQLDFTKMHTIIINFACVGMEIPFLNFLQINSNHLKNVFAVHPSQWALEYNKTLPNYSMMNFETVIGNPLMMDVMTKVDSYKIDKLPRSMVFAASYERGGDIALKVYDKLSESIWKDHPSMFTVMDYYSKSKLPKDRKDIRCIDSADKETVLAQFAKSEYFVYPLVLPDGRVHKDTFGCCVAEALAMGVIVITWPIATLPDTFKDMAVFVDLPEGYNPQLFRNIQCSDMTLYSDRAIEALTKKIIEIESNSSYKEYLKANSMTKVRKLFSDESIGNKWNGLIRFVQTQNNYNTK